MKSNQNPYIALLTTAWRYARNERKRYVLIYCLFILSNLVAMFNPILYGWFINKIQVDNAHTIQHTLWFGLGFFLLKSGEWVFHGPARVMERQLAFIVAQEELLRNERVKYMIELAQLRAVSLPQLMASLGLNMSKHG